MEAKEIQVLKRLTKKLSALRVTLRKDEREMLDLLILGTTAEMKGHALSDAASTAASTAVSDMKGHALSGAASTAASTAVSEMKGHILVSAAATAAQAIRDIVVFDAGKGVYAISDRTSD